MVNQPESDLEERRLRRSGVRGRHGTARPGGVALGDQPQPKIEKDVRRIAEATDSRITLFSWRESAVGPQDDLLNLRFFVRTDSSEQQLVPRNDALLRRALRSGRSQSGFDRFLGDDVLWSPSR